MLAGGEGRGRKGEGSDMTGCEGGGGGIGEGYKGHFSARRCSGVAEGFRGGLVKMKVMR